MASPAHGQANAVLRGVVTDSITGAVLGGVRVELVGVVAGVATSDSRGRFSFTGLAAGLYEVVLARVGYRSFRLRDIQVGGDPVDVAVVLLALGIPLDPVIITASRSEQAALDVPAAVSVVDRHTIEHTGAFTPVEYAERLPGVDFARKGLMQHTFSFRGGNTANSGDVLMLSDFRYAAVPSIGFNVPYLLPVTSADIERVEVMRGPAAALYGPGAPRGVLHVVTRSPFESRGGEVTLTGGTRSVAAGAFRYATRASRSVAFKVSGEYFRGDDWAFTDRVESENRAAALAEGVDSASLLIGRRDPTVERFAGEGRVDWRPAAGTEIITTVGVAQAVRVVEMAPAVGSVQGRDWRYTFAQVRGRRDRLFVNVLYNWSDAGDTYLLRTGAPLADDSRVLVAQLQHGGQRGPVDLLYGADVRWTDPRTGGTIHGANEDDDLVTEAGAYGYASAALSRRVDLHAAIRVDHHNRLNDVVLSPRFGFVVKPSATHALRATYNRAFTSPDANDLFLDIVADRIALAPGLGYNVRAVGVPKDGFTFPRTCNGPCMRSPFNPAGADQYLPADATALWPAVVQLAALQGIDLSGIPAPTAAEVGSVIALLDLDGGFTPIDLEDVADIAGEGRSITNTIELGYKGVLGRGLGLSIDLWANRVSNLGGALFAGTPSVFFDGAELEAYLRAYLPADSAEALAAIISSLPAGTISPRETVHPVDILILNRHGGAYWLFGADLAAQVQLSDRVRVNAAYSFLTRDTIPGVADVGTVYLNVPRHKASAGIEVREEGVGVGAMVAGRAVSGFPVVSGVYAGRVPAFLVLDLAADAPLPGWRLAVLSVRVQNVLGTRHREFVAAPLLGRLVVTRLRVAL
ncbi:MAG TPA: TonB-dependent receptor [Gemmatimonadales bacterium]